MIKECLNGLWKINYYKDNDIEVSIPGSLYSALLDNSIIEDPYYKDNELKTIEYTKRDYTFFRNFNISQDIFDSQEIILCLDGIDTIADIEINGFIVSSLNNMHRYWRFNIKKYIKLNENLIKIKIKSPTQYIKEMQQKSYIGGGHHAMDGFPHIRKAHCMFGWDWGPRLPDMGIWKDVYIEGINKDKIEDISINQFHENDEVFLLVDVLNKGKANIIIELISPQKNVTVSITNGKKIKINSPELWYPNGYGNQPLYELKISLVIEDIEIEIVTKKIGFRTMELIQEKDQWGESFYHRVNGIGIFAMGADYIPEDNIFSRLNEDRTRILLEDCKLANFNVIRVWGGAFYPHDYFFDICDELGLVVWQDFMFACANYELTEEFEESITNEIIDNIKRIRHHASLGLWCGNNEMEMFQAVSEYKGTHKTKADYIKIFEYLIPKLVKKYDPQGIYWPASPSSGGSFDKPNDENIGDVHYWDVWHGGVPFNEYRKKFFRYASEFGFQSFPSIKTIKSFTEKEDRNIFSRIMEMHQRNEGANGKILNYLSQTYLYPNDFEILLYASQLLQAEAIKYGVEHWRNNRGRCMGAVYWQLNDIWPVASWSSIDYFGRWKALHYYAKRFFSPILLTCEEVCETTDRISITMEPSNVENYGVLYITSEMLIEIEGVVEWELRTNKSEIVMSGKINVKLNKLSSKQIDKIVFDNLDYRNLYMSYRFIYKGEDISSGTVLFTAPKHFNFIKPNMVITTDDNFVYVSSDVYAKSVEIYSDESDFILSDNFIDLNGDSRKLKIIRGEIKNIKVRSVYDIR